MSDAGTAKFNHNIKAVTDDGFISSGASDDLIIFHDGTDSKIYNSTGDMIIDSAASDKDLIFKGSDGGSVITALTLDMSAAGLAIFNAGLAIGGTGAANTLDDYEEGTWTMGISDGTNTATLTGSGYNTGKYIKVGSKVYVQGFLDVQSIGSCSGNLTLTGLPFTCANAPNAYGAVLFGYGAGLSITAGTNLAGYIEGNTSDIRLRSWDSTGGTTVLQAGELSTGEFIFSGTYFV
jgi:hypothetical protein